MTTTPHDFQILDSSDVELSSLDFETLRPGTQSEVQTLTLKNTGNGTTVTVTAEESDDQEGDAIDTYQSHYLSKTGTGYSNTFDVYLGDEAEQTFYTYYQPPSDAHIGPKEWQLTLAGSDILTTWDYYTTFTVTNGGGSTETNVTVQVTIPYVAGYMRTDFGDIRFYDGATELDYRIYSKTDSSTATFFLLIPSINGSSSKDITVYAGNPTATADESSLELFYLLYDDFPGSALDTDKWELNGGATASVSGGICTMSPGSGNMRAKIDDIDGPFELHVKYSHPDSNGRIGLRKTDDSGHICFFTNYWNETVWLLDEYPGGNYNHFHMPVTAEVQQDFKLTYDGSEYKAYHDDVLVDTLPTPNKCSGPFHLEAWYGGTFYIDLVSIREIKLTVGSLGSWTQTHVHVPVKGSLYYQSQDLPELEVYPHFGVQLGSNYYE